MQEFLIYLLGWIVFIIGHYIYYMYINKYDYRYKYSCEKNKKLILYNGFKWGIFSWFGIFLYIIVIVISGIIYGIILLDEYIEQKLK